MASISEVSPHPNDNSDGATECADKASTEILKQPVRLTPVPGARTRYHNGMGVPINGGLLLVQNHATHTHSDDKFQGILRYDICANKWSEWIPYPKELDIAVAGKGGAAVLDEKRQILYLFQQQYASRYNQIVIVNLTEKTFRTESNKMLSVSTDEDKKEVPSFFNPKPVMVGDVIYIKFITVGVMFENASNGTSRQIMLKKYRVLLLGCCPAQCMVICNEPIIRGVFVELHSLDPT